MPSRPARDDPRRVGHGIPCGDGTTDVGAGDDAEPKGVSAQVRVGVGELRAAQEAGPHRHERGSTRAGAAADVPAIGAGVGDRQAIAWLADLHPPQRGHLEAVAVPGRVLVDGSGDVAELGLEPRMVGVDVDRPGELEQRLAFLPVDLDLHVEVPGVGREREGLSGE